MIGFDSNFSGSSIEKVALFLDLSSSYLVIFISGASSTQSHMRPSPAMKESTSLGTVLVMPLILEIPLVSWTIAARFLI
jgi:hypothetical protein